MSCACRSWRSWSRIRDAISKSWDSIARSLAWRTSSIRTARACWAGGLGAEAVDLACELVGVDSKPAERPARERVRGTGERDQEISDVGLSLELAADLPR